MHHFLSACSKMDINLYVDIVTIFNTSFPRGYYICAKLGHDTVMVNSSRTCTVRVLLCPTVWKLQRKQLVLSMKDLEWQTERALCRAAAVIHKKFSFIGAWECLQRCLRAHCWARSLMTVIWRKTRITGITCGSLCSGVHFNIVSFVWQWHL